VDFFFCFVANFFKLGSRLSSLLFREGFNLLFKKPECF